MPNHLDDQAHTSDALGVTSSQPCPHTRAHVIDSRFHGHSYSTPESRQIFCDTCRMQRWLDVEVALALSQADLGIIPRTAAAAIERAAAEGSIDMDDVALRISESGHSLVPLLRALQRASGADGEFVHHGATTQDIEDTGQVLEMRDVLDEIENGLTTVVGRLTVLARTHATTVMVGRTHTQPAVPITFGAKVATWLDELLRAAERLLQLRERILVVQLGGGAGTMAAFGDRAFQLIKAFADRLLLGVPRSPWHTARDRVAEFVIDLAMLSGTLGRMADEVRTLSRPEFGELEEGWSYGLVGSSTMPHKRNPDASSQVVALARITKAQVSLALDAMTQEHERDGRGLRLEWVAVADVAHCTLAGISITERLLRDLTVHADRMGENLSAVGDLLCTERLMLELGTVVGKQSAHTLLYDLTQQARSAHEPLRDVLMKTTAVTDHVEADRLARVLDPRAYLGSAPAIAEEVAAAAEEWLKRRQDAR